MGSSEIDILHVVGDSAFGGGSIIITALAEAARDNGYAVAVLGTDPQFSSTLAEKGIPRLAVHGIGRSIHPPRDILAVVRLVRVFRTRRPRIVHTHTSKAGFLGRVAAALARVPAIVHTVHGFPFHEESSRSARSAYVLLERLAASCCHHIVTVSEYHARVAAQLRLATADRLSAIPNGVADPGAMPDRVHEVRRSLGWSPADFVVLALGRLASQKGFVYLVRAMTLAQPVAGRKVLLVIAGEGPERSAIEREIERLGLQHAVRLLGLRRDSQQLLAASDVVAIPSLWEGLSITLLESMAASKPIVATEIPSNAEAVENGVHALTVPVKSPDALRAAVRALALDDDLRERLGCAARSRYLERYRQETMQQRYLSLYTTLLSRQS